jgi:hypothetical protein
MFRRLAAGATSAAILLAVAASTVAAGGPPHVGFYANGDLYRTIGTPTDFSHTGAPASSFDRIFVLGDGLMNVAEAAPGDRDYNGGRWMVVPVTWNTTPHQLKSDAQVMAAAQAGDLTIGTTPLAEFECPVIPIR